MDAKHTSGTWEAVGNLVRSPMCQPDGLPRGVQIAECRDGYFNPHSEEAKANAKLIAAAPELLSALTFLLRGIDSGHIKCASYFDFDPHATQIEFKSPADLARSAIAKATE